MKGYMGALYDWASARTIRLSAQRTLSGFRCEYAEHGSGEPDDPGIPRCYHSALNEPDWCGGCRQRERLRPGWLLLKAAERRAFRRMERAAFRFKRSHDQRGAVPAVATPVAEGTADPSRKEEA
jgi:hypothetical protein